MTIAEAVQAARARLVAAGIQPATAALDAELLARHALGWDRAAYLARTRDAVPSGFADAYGPLVDRRAAREPMAYIRGVQEFYGRDFAVSPAVLIPRAETEILIEEVVALVGGNGDAPQVADAGTGSGNIAITLALEVPGAHVSATDVSGAALEVARANARTHGVADRITFHHAPYLDAVPGPLDLIAANLPYVAERDAPAIQPEVRDHEPREALYGGFDGTRDLRVLLQQAAERLRPGGWLVMEFGFGQEETVRALAADAPALTIEKVRADLQGIDRTAILQKRGRV